MSIEPESGDIWKQLEGVDLSGLDKGKEDQYPTISPSEISEAYGTYPLRGDLMHLAHDSLRKAQAQAEGETARVKSYREQGWRLAIQTPKGILGLWSHWLGNQFYLGYPKTILKPEAKETDELIMKVLEVEKAEPVKQVNVTAVSDWNCKDRKFVDPNKPLEQNIAGQIIGYKDAGLRLWSRFYGPLEPTGGRVWIDSSDFDSYDHQFQYIEDGQIRQIHFGYESSNGVSTFPFETYNKYASEGPTTEVKAVQRYKDRFINLAAEIVFVMGGPRAVDINYGFVLVPEDLDREGYQNVKFLKGQWGNEIIRGQKGDSTVILKSGNSLVPWSTILHAPAPADFLRTPKMLADFIREDILWF
ncbi:MAG: hypothetical protein PHQ59_03770 [Candidatus Daviesbacteria bacterium]|nr:hypothetical protein [Candidatus Daviesbacteria bacterium]